MFKQVFYGWWIVAGLFVVLTVSSGFGFYNLSVYMNVLAEARGFSVSHISVAVSLFFVVGGVAGIGVARLLERFDVRWIMIAGAALAGVALAMTGYATSLPWLYGLYALFGIGNTGVSIVVSTTLVTRWFPGRERSVALSVASTGLSLGGVLITPISARLLSTIPLETVLPGFGLLFFLVILPVALWIVRDPPAPVRSIGTQAEPQMPGWRYTDAVRSRFFVLLTAAYVLCMGAQVGGIAHLYNHAEGQAGYLVAANAVQVLTLMSIVSRIGGGFVVTRLSIRWFTLGNLALQTVGLGLLAVAGSTSLVLIGAAVFGATVGNLLMLHPLWLADAFGVAAYPRIFSLSNAFTVLGLATGPVMLGVLHDLYDYRWSYSAAALLSCGAFGLLFIAGAKPQRSSTCVTDG